LTCYYYGKFPRYYISSLDKQVRLFLGSFSLTSLPNSKFRFPGFIFPTLDDTGTLDFPFHLRSLFPLLTRFYRFSPPSFNFFLFTHPVVPAWFLSLPASYNTYFLFSSFSNLNHSDNVLLFPCQFSSFLRCNRASLTPRLPFKSLAMKYSLTIFL